MQTHTDSEGEIRLRTATPADGEAIGTLFTNSPDEGAVSFAPRFEYDPYEVYAGLRPETTGFVAETDDGRLVGVGFVSNTKARFDGEVRPSALLNALAVHPDFRNRGLAKRIVERRIAHAREQLGEDCVVFANIQHGNDPSEAVAAWWADSLAAEFVMYPAPPIPAAPSTDVDVHDASAEERVAAVDRSNNFYAETDVYRPYTVDGLTSRLADSPIDEPLHRYVVATVDDEVVAGVFASEMHNVMSLVVDSLPPELEDADALPPAIPESKELRMTMLSDYWYAPGHEAAARALWNHLRANPGGANRIMLNYDPRGRVGEVLDLEDGVGEMTLSVGVTGGSIRDEPIAPLF
ncbi:GNAT family N-acetyltransferase [Salinadaptatus halalkaliphilus]|uniref:GNAT family N-acetyltransferase n=1 Tax=Salinadaptatus halalkaliphilus TaxID=2419781 RepID=A0A4S3TMT8_9EURY|nr:GNAT family N-acetyltransferase [Salinadaptatus halalkaliphilus]THE65579.1 GNAT family N-acetyltransferase [Salinadaptatus halalkaliphilus]